MCTPYSLLQAVSIAERSGKKDTGVHEVVPYKRSRIAGPGLYVHQHHIEQVHAMIKSQTDQGISLHQSLTTAFDPMTILQQSLQFRAPESSLQQPGRVDTTQSLSEHEGLNAVRQALQQRENLPLYDGPNRCYGCGLTGHFGSSCPDKVGSILSNACTLFIQM